MAGGFHKYERANKCGPAKRGSGKPQWPTAGHKTKNSAEVYPAIVVTDGHSQLDRLMTTPDMLDPLVDGLDFLR